MAVERTGIDYIVFFEKLRRDDIPSVGGKNASLGEMVAELGALGIDVPPGFATTAGAYRCFVTHNGLEGVIDETMDALTARRISLQTAGDKLRRAFVGGNWPDHLGQSILSAYRELSRRAGQENLAVAVRSSATAEDLPEASFAGQQETFLNITGEAALLEACRKCYASLFTDRAITYRMIHGFDHAQVALSIGVQQMVRADTGGAGVMFSIDTETGFDRVVLINAAWGLGENVVQGSVTPDEFQVYKPFLDTPGLKPLIERKLGAKERKLILSDASGTTVRNVPCSRAEHAQFVLTDDEAINLARQAVTIEDHYGVPMDIEWAKDGNTQKIHIVQARPETVQSRASAGALKSFRVKATGKPLLTGLAVGTAAATGRACLIGDPAESDRFPDGAILVASTTDPDWLPVMKRASAVITDHGGRTSHAAIVSRELGLPAVVGAGNATDLLHEDQQVTVSCAEGDQGFVYDGNIDFDVQEISLTDVPVTRTKVMLNLANPAAAARWWRLPADGIGLARMEFVIANLIRVHPMALVHFDDLKDEAAREDIERLTRGYEVRTDYFVDHLAMGLSRIAAVCHPHPAIVRMSDFKTNEYAELLGGRQFEPREDNPMIGWRGASRYYDPGYREGFALECRAIRRARELIGFDNIIVMVPFCRTPEEADRVLDVMRSEGLERGRNGLQVYIMCEIPSNVILAEEFAARFDGFSIGSNDLTQLTLGIDRDSERLAPLFDERHPAVRWMIETAIRGAHEGGAKIGFCGQAPSNDPDYATLLTQAGIDSISVTPDSFLAVKSNVAVSELVKSRGK